MSSKKVDDFLSGLAHPLKEEMQAIRKMIMEVDTSLTEEVKWSGPSFFFKGNIATFSPRVKDQAVLVFPSKRDACGPHSARVCSIGKAYAKSSSLTCS